MQMVMVDEILFKESVRDMSFDFNGNHVVQRIIQSLGRIPLNYKQMHAFIA